MRRLLFLTFYFLCISAAVAQQHGSISGRVTTADGKPIGFVSVSIVGSSNGASTTDRGNYRITRINPGTYTVRVTAVNIIAQDKQVTIIAGQNQALNFELNLSNAQLKEVMVNARPSGVKMDNPSQSLRLQEPLLQVPQNIQIVSSQSLKEQQITSMSDGVIRNVSGAVRVEHWGDLYTNITMRGSQIQAFRNGFNVVSSFWGPLTEDMSFVDHIEFVKGPAGFMLSNGDPSGLYNVVTKKPTGQTKGEVSLTGGSFDLYRAAVDLDGKLSKDGKLLYRLNLAAQNKGSFRENEFNDRYAVAPVVSYQFNDKTKLTAEYVYQRAHTSDVGSYYIFSKSGYAALPQNTSFLPSGLPPTNINDHSFTLNFQHQLSDNWKLTVQGAIYKYSQLGTSMWADAVNDDGTVVRNYGIWEAESRMYLGQAFVTGKVKTGSIVHRILGGIDMGKKKYVADYAQTNSLDTKDIPFNPYNPVTLNSPSNGYGTFDRSTSLEERAAAGFGLINSSYASLYIQDELGFFNNKMRLTLAGRYTFIKMSDFSTPDDTKHFSPRVGLSVSVDDQTSVYGLYDQTFLPQAGKVSVGTVKPLTGNNIEFGVKKDWADGKWNTTLAAYRILRNNELTPDPNPELPPNSGLSVVLGQKRSQGIEFDLRGELMPGLTLTANYALTDSKVTKVNADVAALPEPTLHVGDVVPGYAKHVANAWLSYKIVAGKLSGTGISLGGTYLAGRQTDTWSVGLQKLPNYFKLDGGLFWENNKIRVSGNVFNILDKYTYSGSYYLFLSAYYYQADAPRNFRLSATYRF